MFLAIRQFAAIAAEIRPIGAARTVKIEKPVKLRRPDIPTHTHRKYARHRPVFTRPRPLGVILSTMQIGRMGVMIHRFPALDLSYRLDWVINYGPQD